MSWNECRMVRGLIFIAVSNLPLRINNMAWQRQDVSGQSVAFTHCFSRDKLQYVLVNLTLAHLKDSIIQTCSAVQANICTL